MIYPDWAWWLTKTELDDWSRLRLTICPDWDWRLVQTELDACKGQIKAHQTVPQWYGLGIDISAGLCLESNVATFFLCRSSSSPKPMTRFNRSLMPVKARHLPNKQGFGAKETKSSSCWMSCCPISHSWRVSQQPVCARPCPRLVMVSPCLTKMTILWAWYLSARPAILEICQNSQHVPCRVQEKTGRIIVFFWIWIQNSFESELDCPVLDTSIGISYLDLGIKKNLSGIVWTFRSVGFCWNSWRIGWTDQSAPED